MAKSKTDNGTNGKSLEQILWLTAGKLRKNIDASEYKHYVLAIYCRVSYRLELEKCPANNFS